MHTLSFMMNDNFDFQWDERKRAINRKRHQVDFADAVEVFYEQG